jgi:large subunit ribosomal protein L30
MITKKQSNKLTDGRIKVTQTGSSIGRKYDQEKTLIGLGLGKMHKTRILANTASIQGMVRKVGHLVKVENVD